MLTSAYLTQDLFFFRIALLLNVPLPCPAVPAYVTPL